MAFKRAVIRRVGPLFWLLGGITRKSKIEWAFRVFFSLSPFGVLVTSSLPAQIAFGQFPVIPGFVRRLPRFVVNRLSSHASLGYALHQHRDRTLSTFTALTSSFFPASSLTTQSRGLSWEHCFRVLHLAARQSLILIVRRQETMR